MPCSPYVPTEGSHFPSTPASGRRSVTAVVFDLDGTLIDSVADIGAALDLLLVEFGRRPLRFGEARAMIGDGAAVLVRRAFAATGSALAGDAESAVVARFLDLYAGCPVSPTCLYPGVVETLETLRAAGLRLGLCTNKPQRIAASILAALGLARFFGDAVLGAEVLPVRKPDAAPLLWVLERLGCQPAEAVMVGDGLNDVLSARAAGLPVVAVSYGYSRGSAAGLGADLVIEAFADLPAALERLV